MYEARHQQLLPRHLFIRRLALNLFFSSLLILFSLLIGMCGYHYFEKLSWIDAYVNAAMILSGMGPIAKLETVGGKIFAGSYALFSGIIFLFAIAVMLGPLFHRLMHKFHIQDEQKK